MAKIKRKGLFVPSGAAHFCSVVEGRDSEKSYALRLRSDREHVLIPLSGKLLAMTNSNKSEDLNYVWNRRLCRAA